MAEPKETLDWREKYADILEEPDISHIDIEDDEPVDNIFAEKQHRLLISSLYANWKPKEKFIALTNVGVFNSVSEPPIVPDALISFGVDFPTWEQMMSHKKYRAYFIWVFGKPPDVVVEVVTNRTGDELTEKMEKYARIRVPYYVVYDCMRLYGEPRLRVYKLNGARYHLKNDLSLDEFGLKVALWNGSFEGVSGEWMRWQDESGNLLLSAEEHSAQTLRLAEVERERAEAEKARAEKLAAKLRALGINPDE